MSDARIIKRREVYKMIANDLSLLSDDQLSTLLDSSTPIGNSIGGTSALLKTSNTNVFIKKIRLTDIERRPENKMSTANLFHLPLKVWYDILQN